MTDSSRLSLVAEPREWIVLGPMGKDRISYDPPDFEPAERLVFEVRARTARQAVSEAWKTMGWRDRRDVKDATDGRNPLAALKPLAYPDCYENCASSLDPCSSCAEFFARSEAIRAALDAKYGR